MFRSRLEARWAVFFDEIGLKWIYEIEGFVLNNGICYLPDFYFPELLCYAEIKPDITLTDIEVTKLVEFSKERQIVLLQGLPSNNNHKLYSVFDTEFINFVKFYKDQMKDDSTGKIEQYWRFWYSNENQNDDIIKNGNFRKEAKTANIYQFEY